jgi:hypothetical protein
MQRSRQQQKAIFAKMFGKYTGHMKGVIKIKEPGDSRFAFSPTVPEILRDSYLVDAYGRPRGTIGIGPDMGILGGSMYDFPSYSKRPKK